MNKNNEISNRTLSIPKPDELKIMKLQIEPKVCLKVVWGFVKCSYVGSHIDLWFITVFQTCGQSYKQFTIVNYDTRVVIWANL